MELHLSENTLEIQGHYADEHCQLVTTYNLAQDKGLDATLGTVVVKGSGHLVLRLRLSAAAEKEDT